jgi:hypothetical protein
MPRLFQPVLSRQISFKMVAKRLHEDLYIFYSW